MSIEQHTQPEQPLASLPSPLVERDTGPLAMGRFRAFCSR